MCENLAIFLHSCQVHHHHADADVLIVQKTLDSAEHIDTVLVGDDTDLLILLLHHAKPKMKDVFFIPKAKKNSQQRIWNIKETKEKLGQFICKHLLFLHAFLGSDTTSRVYGIGKSALMKKIQSHNKLREAAEKFSSNNSSVADIEKAREIVMCTVYNGKVKH